MGNPLNDWVRAGGRGSISRLMEKTGLRWATIYDIATGASVPSVATAQLIEKATAGEVSAVALVGLGKKKRKRVAK